MSEENPWAYVNDTKGNEVLDRYINAIIRCAPITEIIELAEKSAPMELPSIDSKFYYWYRK